jgi:hypothetical protein
MTMWKTQWALRNRGVVLTPRLISTGVASPKPRFFYRPPRFHCRSHKTSCVDPVLPGCCLRLCRKPYEVG